MLTWFAPWVVRWSLRHRIRPGLSAEVNRAELDKEL
jgi:hypothetical protein